MTTHFESRNLYVEFVVVVVVFIVVFAVAVVLDGVVLNVAAVASFL